MSVKERIREFIKYTGLTTQQFEGEVGLSNGYIANMRRGIGPVALERISNKYPGLNKAWLLTGEGEMLKNPTTGAGQSQSLQSELSGDRFDRMMNIMEIQAKQLQAQSERIDALIEQNNKLLKELGKQDTEEGIRSHEASARS